MNSLQLICGIILLSRSVIYSEIIQPVHWSYDINKISNTESELVFSSTIRKGWRIYDTEIEGVGPIPTSITFMESRGYETVGPLISVTKPVVKYDSTFQIRVGFFEKNALFLQRVRFTDTSEVTIKALIEMMACNDSTCLSPADTEFTFNFKSGAIVKDEAALSSCGNEPINAALWSFFWIALMAGFLALFTPCVFPMIPLIVSYFINKKEGAGHTKREGLIFGFSIVLIYIIIGTVVSLALGADFVTLLSSHWIPNVLFFLIFLLFSLSLFGMFEINLPGWLVNSASKQSRKEGFLQPFFMALTLVVASFSCTGPIVGALLVQAAQGELLRPVIGMTGFSLGFALPFTMLSFSPRLLSNLPKSGGWLNSVKVVLGFIVLALSLKFLSIADDSYHWNILSREIFLSIWIVIFGLCGFYLLGKIRLPHDDTELKHISVPRLILALITLSFTVYLIPGLFGSDLKLLASYIPHRSTVNSDSSSITKGDNIRNDDISADLCGRPKYSDILHLPQGLKGYFDYDQALECAKKYNKPLFVNFTGHGCVNCRKMESAVFSDKRVCNLLNEKYIVIALYVDEKTPLPESEWYKSLIDGKLKKTIGKKNADFQITRFKVNVKPYYILLDTNENLLVPPKSYDLNPDRFVSFLESGLTKF